MLIWGGSGKHFSTCECLVKALLDDYLKSPQDKKDSILSIETI